MVLLVFSHFHFRLIFEEFIKDNICPLGGDPGQWDPGQWARDPGQQYVLYCVEHINPKLRQISALFFYNLFIKFTYSGWVRHGDGIQNKFVKCRFHNCLVFFQIYAQMCVEYAISYWLLAIGYWLLAISYWLLSISYWLLAIGYQLLPIGY